MKVIRRSNDRRGCPRRVGSVGVRSSDCGRATPRPRRDPQPRNTIQPAKQTTPMNTGTNSSSGMSHLMPNTLRSACSCLARYLALLRIGPE